MASSPGMARRGHLALLSGRLLLLCIALLPLLVVSCGGASGGNSPAPPAVPGQVTGPSATAGAGEITLRRNAISGATSYNVQRSTSGSGPFSSIAEPVATNYTDASVSAGTTYYYEVAAVNSAGTGEPSAVVSATPTPAAPGQVSNLTATPAVRALEKRPY